MVMSPIYRSGRSHLTRHSNHHHHLSLNREGHWGTTDDFTTSFLHFSLFSTALWDLVNSRPVCSLMLSSYLFLCLPCLLPPFTVPCKMVLARPDGDMVIWHKNGLSSGFLEYRDPHLRDHLGERPPHLHHLWNDWDNCIHHFPSSLSLSSSS